MAGWGRRKQPLIVAHRGASSERPENTVAAFRLAQQQGADAIELDVVRCGSGEVVVFHDDDLQRLAGRHDKVRLLSLAELRQVRVAGEPIPTLDEVVAAVGPDLLLNVELKAPSDQGVAHRLALRDDGLSSEVARLVDRPGLSERVLISSFHPILLARFRRAAPRVATGLLFQHQQSLPLRAAWAARLLRPTALHPERVLVDRRVVERWHGQGLAVNVWTVDDPHEIAFLAAIGVDGIITNTPAAARAAIAA